MEVRQWRKTTHDEQGVRVTLVPVLSVSCAGTIQGSTEVIGNGRGVQDSNSIGNQFDRHCGGEKRRTIQPVVLRFNRCIPNAPSMRYQNHP